MRIPAVGQNDDQALRMLAVLIFAMAVTEFDVARFVTPRADPLIQSMRPSVGAEAIGCQSEKVFLPRRTWGDWTIGTLHISVRMALSAFVETCLPGRFYAAFALLGPGQLRDVPIYSLPD